MRERLLRAFGTTEPAEKIEATREQVQTAIEAGFPAFRVDPFDIAMGKVDAAKVLNWMSKQSDHAIPLVYSSDDPAKVSLVQEKLGRDKAGQMYFTQVFALPRKE